MDSMLCLVFMLTLFKGDSLCNGTMNTQSRSDTTQVLLAGFCPECHCKQTCQLVHTSIYLPVDHECIAFQVIDRLEATMRLKRFNQLGGLQLDRDVRILTSTLADITQQAVRDHFVRLSQMATILSLESVAEFLEYWGESSSISWRFGENQVREVLQQRTDFSRDEIVALPLYVQ